ncbi:MAG: hypothetical protein H6718_04400 [Polyangiaceae bacterium]|nr:hypothetical protein [Polyangiaceae bacterium]
MSEAFPRRETKGRARLWSWFLSVGAGGVLTLTIATIAIVVLARYPQGSDSMPQWVPVYPGVSVQDTKLNKDGVSGHYRFLAGTDTDSILNWYREQLETRGFTSEDYSGQGQSEGDGQALRFISERDQLEVVVTLRADPKGEQADVVFGRL